jgi:hypothetical protein
VPCRDRDGTVSQYSDRMRSARALRDWLSGFCQCRAVTMPCAVVFHTYILGFFLQSSVVKYTIAIRYNRLLWKKIHL